MTDVRLHNVEPLIGYDLTEVKAAVKTLARSNRYIPRIIVNGAVKLGVLRGDRFLEEMKVIVLRRLNQCEGVADRTLAMVIDRNNLIVANNFTDSLQIFANTFAAA